MLFITGVGSSQHIIISRQFCHYVAGQIIDLNLHCVLDQIQVGHGVIKGHDADVTLGLGQVGLQSKRDGLAVFNRADGVLSICFLFHCGQADLLAIAALDLAEKYVRRPPIRGLISYLDLERIVISLGAADGRVKYNVTVPSSTKVNVSSV